MVDWENETRESSRLRERTLDGCDESDSERYSETERDWEEFRIGPDAWEVILRKRSGENGMELGVFSGGERIRLGGEGESQVRRMLERQRMRRRLWHSGYQTCETREAEKSLRERRERVRLRSPQIVSGKSFLKKKGAGSLHLAPDL